ncbi:MAG: DNA (cytosine-5-)-methyltransferase [Melioribacteraceae bacterium]|nr:MAG: DNA (cytosine-5-)-methyltransferase [Melioribacteraceae bacterium]
MKKDLYKIGELYCGPGGLALGSHFASIKNKKKDIKFAHVWANDYDYWSCTTFNRNIFGNKGLIISFQELEKIVDKKEFESKNLIINDDIKKIKVQHIDRLEDIDGFVYGFPCNDFSIVGESKGINGKFGGLYSYGIEIIKRKKPLFIVAENVGGIRSSNDGKAFDQILTELRYPWGNNSKLFYNLSVHLYKAEDYGVPQKRHRIVIVGFRSDSGLEFKVPAVTHTPNKFISVKTALKHIPKNTANNEFTKQSDVVVERLKRIKPGYNAWNSGLTGELALKVKGAKLSQIYRRLHPDEPSYTITGSGGGGTHVYHWEEPRALTNRERARLQTFPDNFIFEGNKESVRKQIGMAVPPKLATIIFEAILKTIYGEKYNFIENGNLSDRLNNVQNNLFEET